MTAARAPVRNRAEPAVAVSGVTIEYAVRGGRTLRAVERVSFEAAPASCTALIGPSGCGKSTLLRAVAGFEPLAAGSIRVHGSAMSRPRPDEIGMTFQDPCLLPWRTLAGNVELGLEFRMRDKRRRRDLARAELDAMGLSDYAGAYPHQISGGMKQRVAFARALAWKAPLLLLDEPLASIDELARMEIVTDVGRLLFDESRAALLVTHSISEALLFADTVVVLSARPARVLDVLTVPLPRPRRPQDLADPLVVAVQRRLLHLLAAQQGRDV